MNFYAFFFVKCFWLFAGGVSWATATTTTATAANCCDWFAKSAETRPHYQRGSLSLRSLSVDARSLSLTALRSVLSPSPHLSLCLPLVLFCANCLQHFLNASWSQHLKHFNLLLLSRSTFLLSHVLSSLTLSLPLSLSLFVCKVCSAFVKMAASAMRALSLSVAVVVVAVGRNTVELEQQFAAIWIWRDKKILQLVLWPIYDKRLW